MGRRMMGAGKHRRMVGGRKYGSMEGSIGKKYRWGNRWREAQEKGNNVVKSRGRGEVRSP